MYNTPLTYWGGRVLLGSVAAFALGLHATPASATPAPVAVVNNTLRINATNADDRVALRLTAGAPGTLEIDFGDDGTADHSFDRNAFDEIRVSLRSGDDQFRVDQANGAFADEALSVDGGNGNDTLNGGDGNEILDGGRGDDAIDGNRGADVGVLGQGTDSFRWDPGDGSDIVEGNSGQDTLDFNGAAGPENMALTPVGKRSLFFRDAGTIRMDMDGVERLDLTALGGIDTVTVADMSGTDFESANVDLAGPNGQPDGANDVITVEGTAKADNVTVTTDNGAISVAGARTPTRISGADPTDTLRVHTLAGDDNVDVAQAVLALIGVTVDLGIDES